MGGEPAVDRGSARVGTSEHEDAPLWAVAVFAHNEETTLADCLRSVDAAACGRPVQVWVLANGCTDRTVERAREYAQCAPHVQIAEIALGDKANAWNAFVHELAPPASCYFFVDGDVRISERAFVDLAAALRNDAHVHIAAGVPGSGRNQAASERGIIVERGVQGNLYAASSEFVRRARSLSVRLPIGYVREDGLVGALAKWNFAPETNPWDDDRVVVVTSARFFFKSVSPLELRAWPKYWRRLVRYSTGRFETVMMRKILTTEGVSAIPRDVVGLYRCSEDPSLRWRGLDTLVDFFALRKLRARRNSGGSE